MRADRVAWLAALLALAPALAAGEEPGARVVLRWQAIPGAAGYDLQIAADPGFAARELDVRLDLAGYRLPAPPEARRYWRVRSVDADGRPGPWSAAKTIEPLVRPPVFIVAPEPAPLDVPPPAPAPLADAVAAPADAGAPAGLRAARASEEGPPLLPAPEPGFEGYSPLDVLRAGRPGVLVGWRANLLGVDAASVALEGDWPLPWLGAAWRAALRAGWWRARATVPPSGGLAAAVDATADVVPLTALLFGSFRVGWARLYAGAGLGADLVVIRQRDQGALAASPALVAVAGGGRAFGPGELFGELSGGLGGVDEPLGRLRTGGISLSVGYRLSR